MNRKSSNNSEASYGETTAPKVLDSCSITRVPNTKYQHLAKNGNGTPQSKVVPSPSYQFQMRRKLVIYILHLINHKRTF